MFKARLHRHACGAQDDDVVSGTVTDEDLGDVAELSVTLQLTTTPLGAAVRGANTRFPIVITKKMASNMYSSF